MLAPTLTSVPSKRRPSPAKGLRGSRDSAVVGMGPSLGWGVLNHIARYLPSPSDPLKPFIFTDEQALITVRWYAVDADTAEFLQRRGELEMAKGWGKSPFVGGIAIEEFVGPVLFDHWDNGEPIGKPWFNPWVQIAAVSEDQTDNTYHALYEMLTANDHRAAKELGIDDGRTRLYIKGRPGVLEPVTASAGSREGQRLTFAVLDETHLWTRRNGGVKLAGTLRRNAAKMNGRTFETTNAPALGEKSVAEQSALDPGVMRYARRPARQPDSDWPDAKLLAALDEAYGDAIWIDRKRLLAEIHDPATSWDDALRYYFNIRTTGSGRAIDPLVWDALAQPRDLPAGTYIGLGFDGSFKDDATVLRGCTADGYRFTVGKWIRPDNASPDWRVPRAAVHEALAEAFRYYHVGRMLADPPLWQSELEVWAGLYGADVVLEFDTRQTSRIAPALDRWRTAIREGAAFHDGDPVIADHVKAAHLKKLRIMDADDSRTPYTLEKGEDRRKIDGAMADVLALEAAATMPVFVERTDWEPMVAWR